MDREEWLAEVRRVYRGPRGRKRIAAALGVNPRTEDGHQFIESVVAAVALGPRTVSEEMKDLPSKLRGA